MKMKTRARWLASLMAASMVVGSFSVPAAAKDVKEEPAKAASFVPETKAEKGNFNKEWKFYLGDDSNASAKEFDDSNWEDIQIPHDFSMDQEFSAQYEAESGFLPGGTGWYRKNVVFPRDYEGKTLILNFDGVYNHAYVYVNGTKIGENFYGYNDFSFNITDYVTCDGETENVISVKTVNEFPSSRWYSGSGIYRDVTLMVAGDIHVADEGTYVTTPNLEEEQNGDVTVHVETEVKNERDAEGTVTVRTTLLDENGEAVSEAAEAEMTLEADAQAMTEQEILVNQPKLWDCDEPNLYYVQTEILDGDEVIDSYETEFGFRYIEFDANEGFLLNGENVKMKGVCMHHDQGALGAASYYDAVKRQVEILKGMGCNAIRSSHNVPSDMLISICNEEGMLVMDELFDGWTNYKNGNYNDFGKEFNTKLAADNQVIGGNADMTWSQFTLETTINRDKNDPSVVMWSIGNELPTGCVGGNNCQTTYPGIATNLIKWIKDIDDTKPITMGDNQSSWSSSDFRTNIDRQLAAANGVVGLNYYPTQYANKHNQQPTWPLVGTETASPANSRGIYNTLSSSSSFGDYQCTAYDTASVGWGNTARESWYYTIKNDFIMGEFIWTGFDYIGEPTGTGPWNGTGTGSVVGGNQAVPNSCYFGVIDTAGFPKDSYYYYSSQWVEDKTTLHVVPQSWNEEDLVINNGKVPVYLYSNAAKVELFLNDVKIGTATRNDFTTSAGYKYATYTNVSDNADLCTAVNESAEWKRMAAQFNVQYEAGTLSAKAYDEAGNLIEDTYGLDYVTTNSDKGTYLKAEAEKSEIQADGSSLSYIAVDVMDANDEFVSAARNNIRLSLTGNGTIVGVDNGNPSTTDKFQQPTVLTSDKTANIDAFQGKALVIVRSTEKAGGFTLKAESAGLTGAAVTVNTAGENQGEAYVKDYKIKKEYTVTMGTAPELETEVDVTMSDGETAKGALTWEEVTEDIYNAPGEYTINGVLSVGEEEIAVEAFLTVLPVFCGFKNYSRATSKEVVPALPKTVAGILENGEVYGEYPVVWDEIAKEDIANVDDVITVAGTIKLSEEISYKTYATVRVAEGETMEPVNVAPMYATLTESCGQKADNLLSIVNGVKNNTSSAQERWTNWNDHLQSSSPFITFTWDEAKEVDVVKLWFYTDNSVSVPEKVTIEVAEDGLDFREVGYSATAFSPSGETTFTLDGPHSVKGVRITMKQQGNGYVGLKEAEIWTTAFGYTMNSTATLDSLTVDGVEVGGFVAGEVNEDGYTAAVEDAENAVILAKAKDNAAVTVVPVNESGVAKVIVQSENQLVTNEYVIRFNEEAVQHEGKRIQAKASVAEITYEEIPQSIMKADCSATSFKSPVQYNDGGADFAFDGSLGTAWHTSYTEPSTYEVLPQSIEFGLGEEQLVGKLKFQGKTPEGNNGLIKEAVIYAKSGDGDWKEVKTFTFTEGAKGNGEVIFDEPVTADRMKVEVRDSYNQIAYKLACIGEIHVYKAILPEPFEVNVAMDWQDGDNADSDRPESVEVGLMVDGSKVEGSTLTLSAENNWAGTFENVDPEMGNTFAIYSITEDFNGDAQEGYVYKCGGTIEEGFVVSAVKSVAVDTEVNWNDNNNKAGKRANTVTLIYKGAGQTEFASIASNDVLPNIVTDKMIVPKYQADGTPCEYTVSGGKYTNADYNMEEIVKEDGTYVITYSLEGGEEPGPVGTDKSDLEALLTYAGEQMAKDAYASVIPAVRTALEAKYREAEAILADNTVSQEEVNQVYKELLALVHMLDFIGGDNKPLQILVKEVEDIYLPNIDNYTEETAAALQNAYNEALKVLEDGENALAGDIEAARTALQKAKDELVEKEVITDKSRLEQLVAQAEGILAGDTSKYTEESVVTLTSTLAVGQAVLENKDASQGLIDAAADTLEAAINGLSEKAPDKQPADKSALIALYEEVKDTDVTNYTDGSVNLFQAALNAAAEVIANDTLTEDDQDVVDRVKDTLQAAFDGLTLKETPGVEKDALKKLIDKSVQYVNNEAIYTEESFAIFKAAYDAALMVYNDEAATQEEVDAARATLEAARRTLREIPNKDKLEELIGKIKEVDLSLYTAKTAKAVKAAYAKAMAVFEDENATQVEIDEAVKALEKVTKEMKADKKAAAGDQNSDNNKKVASDGSKTSSAGTSGKTTVKTGDAANAAIPAAAGLVAILAAIIAWKKRTNA